ncbi:MAG: DUF1292 domain-containing protein [Lachnospiraceae bacterium]|nr:DUF1292 domain-containing protein [Lachnospiraceae bacterium]
MDHEEEMITVDTFSITMENGTDQEYAIMDEFDFEEKHYLVVSPVSGDEIEEDIFLYRSREDGEDLIVDYIEDDKEYEKAAAAYEALCEEAGGKGCDCEEGHCSCR